MYKCHFAEPLQKVEAIQLYCSDAYGALLYDFASDYADSLFKAWNIQVRLDWDTPPTSWLVEGYFCDQNAMFKESDHEQISKFCEETFRFTKQRSKILEPRVTE